MRYIVCYDVSSPRRLARIARILERYGRRVQRSFFCCDVTGAELLRMKEALLPELDVLHDRLAFYSLCHRCFSQRFELGRLVDLEIYSFLVL